MRPIYTLAFFVNANGCALCTELRLRNTSNSQQLNGTLGAFVVSRGVKINRSITTRDFVSRKHKLYQKSLKYVTRVRSSWAFFERTQFVERLVDFQPRIDERHKHVTRRITRGEGLAFCHLLKRFHRPRKLQTYSREVARDLFGRGRQLKVQAFTSPIVTFKIFNSSSFRCGSPFFIPFLLPPTSLDPSGDDNLCLCKKIKIENIHQIFNIQDHENHILNSEQSRKTWSNPDEYFPVNKLISTLIFQPRSLHFQHL